MSENPTFRPITVGEQAQALALWQTVFTETPGFFERYFRPEFGYQDGDTLGAWLGERLVSAVHLCRCPVSWDDESLLCGGIANVATLPEFRRRGFSRRLLEMTVARMEREGFDFSLLGTGVPGHYAALGWELTGAPRATIQLTGAPLVANADWQRLGATVDLAPLYSAHPRPLQFDRSDLYFEGWVGWNWRRFPMYVHTRPRNGYLVLGIPDEADGLIFATEWRASNAEAEAALLQDAAAEVRRRGRGALGLEARPQYLGEDFLHSLGTVTADTDHGGMVRNISLSPEKYQRLTDAYRMGRAVWWSADGF